MRNRFLDGYSMIQYSNAPGIHYGADQVIFPGYTWVGYPVPLRYIMDLQIRARKAEKNLLGSH